MVIWYLRTFIIAHAAAVGTSSLAGVLTALLYPAVARIGCWPDCGATSSLMWDDRGVFITLVSIIFMFFVFVAVNAVLLLPATMIAFPLALIVATRFSQRWEVALIGGIAGPLVGLPLVLLTLGSADPGAFLAQFALTYEAALAGVGLTAFLTGSVFAWIVATAVVMRSDPNGS